MELGERKLGLRGRGALSDFACHAHSLMKLSAASAHSPCSSSPLPAQAVESSGCSGDSCRSEPVARRGRGLFVQIFLIKAKKSVARLRVAGNVVVARPAARSMGSRSRHIALASAHWPITTRYQNQSNRALKRTSLSSVRTAISRARRRQRSSFAKRFCPPSTLAMLDRLSLTLTPTRSP